MNYININYIENAMYSIIRYNSISNIKKRLLLIETVKSKSLILKLAITDLKQGQKPTGAVVWQPGSLIN